MLFAAAALRALDHAVGFGGGWGDGVELDVELLAGLFELDFVLAAVVHLDALDGHGEGGDEFLQEVSGVAAGGAAVELRVVVAFGGVHCRELVAGAAHYGGLVQGVYLHELAGAQGFEVAAFALRVCASGGVTPPAGGAVGVTQAR